MHAFSTRQPIPHWFRSHTWKLQEFHGDQQGASSFCADSWFPLCDVHNGQKKQPLFPPVSGTFILFHLLATDSSAVTKRNLPHNRRTFVWRPTWLWDTTPTCWSSCSPWCWWPACLSCPARRTSNTYGKPWRSDDRRMRPNNTSWTKSRSAGTRVGRCSSTGSYTWC